MSHAPDQHREPVPRLRAPGSLARREAPVVPTSPLFRERAVAAYVRADVHGRVLAAVGPGTWSLFWAIVCIFITTSIASFVARVELTTRGRGSLRSPGGVQPLVSQTAGIVRQVHARSGQQVEKGALLVEVDTASVQAALLEADERLRVVRSSLAALQEHQQVYFSQRVALLGRRAVLLLKRIDIQKETLTRLGHKADSIGTLADRGIVGALQADEAREEVAQARRQLLAFQEELGQTQLQLTTLRSDRESEVFRLSQEAEQANAKRKALAFSLEESKVVAPQSGYLEAMLVRAGDVVQPGAQLGKLVPALDARDITAFVPERDRAFLETGAEARIEVDQLPVGEFGALRAHVRRIGGDLASPVELKEVLGEPLPPVGAVYKVELELENDEQARRLRPYLRAGVLVTARFSLRRRRLITLVFDPLRRFLE